jgi:hypothetical protein
MLQMIFQNDDLMNDEYFHDDYQNHYLYHTQKQNEKQKQKRNQKQKNLTHINNETDDDWGFYVEFDPPTPPKDVFPKKNENTSQAYLATHLSYNETTQQKNVNYLPQIEEEDRGDQFILDIDLPHYHSNSNDHSNSNNNNQTYKDYNEKISQKIFSGLTICALTTASIYFYNKIRSS